MKLFRYASLFSLLAVCSLGFGQWTPMIVGNTGGTAATGSRSITSFEGALYVATYNTGIRKSTDGGASWTLANTGLPSTGGTVNVQSVGHNASVLFCGTESGVYRSMNGGATWEIANGPVGASLPASSSIYANKIYTFNNVTFVVFSGMISNNSGGVFRTTDNGTSWLQAFSGLSQNMTVYNLAQDGNTLYASTSSSLMKSTDLGQSWTQAGTADFAVFSVQSVAGRIVAITSLGTRWSTNGGTTWTNSMDYPVSAPAAGSELIAYDGKYYAITKSGSLGCWRSLNGGVNWVEYNDGLSEVDKFSQEEFHATGTGLYIACLFDSYSLPGSTVGLGKDEMEVLPMPYPTTFNDFFALDLSSMKAGNTVLLLDASGKEVSRTGNLPASVVRVERGTLVAGRYQVVLLDQTTGAMRSLGPVIAQ